MSLTIFAERRRKFKRRTAAALRLRGLIKAIAAAIILRIVGSVRLV